VGGKGNDSYLARPGTSSLIADSGSDAGNSLSATGVGLFDANTRLATIETGKTLVLDNAVSQTRVYLYDWLNPIQQLQMFTLSDGVFSRQQLQARLTTLGAAVRDYSWAQWDAQFSGGRLSSLGLSTAATIDALAATYQTIDAAGPGT
jgi:hypothetical protein